MINNVHMKSTWWIVYSVLLSIDSNAIAFKCWLNNEWVRIGFVVKEARDTVHKAKEDGLFGQISFK